MYATKGQILRTYGTLNLLQFLFSINI